MSRIGKILGTLAVVMLTTAGSLYGSITPQGIFTEYTAIDGMAHNNIHEIYTDSQGYVWLCTWSGVSRFDGYTFKNYCTDPKNMPVRNNRFRSVDEDKAGNLWFRTYDDHIYRFNRLTEEFDDVCEGIEQLLLGFLILVLVRSEQLYLTHHGKLRRGILGEHRLAILLGLVLLGLVKEI